MAKKDLVSDIPEFETDFDFDFENEIDGELNQEAVGKKKSRGVIGNVFMGAMTGARDEVVSPSFIKDTLRKSLPDTYGEVADAGEELTTGLYELYDETVKEIKPRVGRISAKVNQLIPDEAKRLKSLSEKIARWGGEDIGGEYTPTVNQEEQAVAMSLAGVFEQQEAQNKLDGAKDLIKERIGTKRFSATYDLQRSTDRNIAIQTQYTVNTNQRFQRKSLELQVRTLLAQKEYYSKSSASFKVFQAQLEAVVKNTAMPEYLKITESERFKEVSKKRFIESLYGEGSFLRQGLERLKGSARQAVTGFTNALDSADMGLDTAIDAKEMVDSLNESFIEMGGEPLSKAEMLGATAGANIATWFRDVIAKRVKELNMDDDVVQEKFAKYANIANNPSGALEKLRQSESWQEKVNDYSGDKGKLYRFFDLILDNFADQSPNRTVGNATDLDELDNPSMGFDVKAHISLTDIIPGHLANIHREIVMLRTGRNNAERQVYDFKRREFTSEADMGDRVERDLTSGIKRSGYAYYVEKAVEIFAKDENLDEDQLVSLRRFFSQLSRDDDNPLDPDSILSSPAFEKLPDELQDLVEHKLRGSEDSVRKERDQNDLTKAIKTIRKNTPASEKMFSDFNKAGYGDLIAKKGLTKKRDDGTYAVDEEAYAKFLEDSAFIRSDMNVKEAIRELSPRELLKEVSERFKGKKIPGSQDYQALADRYFKNKRDDEESSAFDKFKRFDPKRAYEGIKNTRLYNWFYKQGKGDEEPHSGPMAQEVQKNLGSDVAPKGKMIDLQSMNGAMMAAIKHLGERVESFIGGQKEAASDEVKPTTRRGRRNKGKSAEEITNELLARIQKDTSEVVKRLEAQEKLTQELMKNPMGGTGVIPNQLMHDGTYRGMITSIIRSTMDLGFKAGAGTFDTLKEFFTPGEKTAKAKSFFTQTKDFLKGQLTDKESGTRKAFGTLYEKASSFAGTVFDQAKSFLTEGLPSGLKFIKDKVSKAFTWMGDKLNEAKDLYLPDGTEPVIRAVKLKAGFYRDSITGEVLDTIDKLNQAKGDIVDSAGNVILSLEERAKGLYDRYGEKIRGNAMNVARLVTKGAAWVGSKVRKGFNALTDKSLTLGGKLKAWWDQPTDWGQFGINFGENRYAKESYEVLLDIRDILLNQKAKVLRRVKKRESAKNPEDKAPSNLADAIKEANDESFVKIQEFKEKAKTFRDKLKGFFGFGSPSEVSGDAESNEPNEGQGSASSNPSGSSGGFFNTAGISGLFHKGKALFNKEKYQSFKDKASGLKDRLMSRFKKTKNTPPTSTSEAEIVENPTRATHEVKLLAAPQTTQRAGTALIPYNAKKAGSSDIEDAEIISERPHRNTMLALPAPGGLSSDKAPKASKLGGLKDAVKGRAKGLLNLRGGLLGGVTSALGGLGSLLGGNKEAEPNASQETQAAKKPSLLKRVKNKIDSAKRAWNDRDGSGTRDGSVEERDEKLAELKASRQKDEAKADLTARYKNGGLDLMGLLTSGLSMAMKGFSGLFSLIGKGLGGVMGMAGKLLSMTPGALVKGVAGTVKLAGKGLWAGTKLAGKGLFHTAKFGVTRALPGLALGAANMAGGAIGAVASVLGSPVVLGAAAIAGAGYGLYKLYQFAHRNDADDFERIRLSQYGFGYNKDVDQYNHYPYMLEAYLEDGRVGYDNGKAYINEKKVKPEELLEIFKIDQEDTEQAQKFTAWYKNRFKPFFLTHMTALTATSPKAKLKDVAKFTPDEKIKYLGMVGFESGPYGEDQSPIKELQRLSTDNTFVKKSIEALIAKAQVDKPKDTKSNLPPAKPGESKMETVARGIFDKMTFGLFKSKEGEADQAQKLKIEEERRKNAEANKAKLQTSSQSEDGGQTPKATEGPTEKSTASLPGKVAMAPGAPLEGTAGRQFVKLNEKTIDIDRLNPTMLKLFLGMAEEYGKITGKSIIVTSGTRTYEEQMEMKRKYGAGAAAPGSSLHEFGLALDIDSKNADELDKLGLMKKYGFTRPVGGEPWHVEPAGIQKNPSEAKRNGAIRDAMVSAGVMRGGGGYGSMAGSTKGKRNSEVALGLLNLPPSPPPELKAGIKDQVLQPPKFSEAAKFEPYGPDNLDKVTQAKLNADQNIKAGTPPSKSASLAVSQKVAQENSATNDLPPPDAEEKPSVSQGGKAAAVSGDIKEQIAAHAKRAGEDPNLMQAFAAVESDMNPQAKAPTSSAAGLFQFIRSTWDSMVSKFSSKYGLDRNASPFNVEASSLMAAEYIKQNKKIIAPVKPNPNLTDLYLAHFLGPGGARAFLSMPPDAIAANRFPGPAKSNQNIFYKDGKPLTVKQVYDNLSAKLNEKSARYGVKAPTGGMGLNPTSKGPGLDINPSQSPITKPMAGETVSAQKVASPTAGPNAGQRRAPEPKSSSSGLFIENRMPGVPSSGRVESGEGMGANFGSITSALDKSVGIQQESLGVLREILSNVKVEKVAEVIATMIAASNKAAKPSEEKASPKEQDKLNLGRKDQTGPSALDMRRRI